MTLKIIANSQDLPLSALIVADLICSSKKGNITITYPTPWNLSSNIQLFTDEKVICEDNYAVGRYLARTMDNDLYGGDDKLLRTQVDSWISFSSGPLQSSSSIFEALNKLNTTLSSRTWLVCKQVTLADIYVFTALYKISSSFLDSSDTVYQHVVRWYTHFNSLPCIHNISKLQKVPTMSTKQTKLTPRARKQEGKFIELPGAESGKVVVRFPPEASGYLHIGHAKAALLNQYYAQAFSGQLIMRFDDTNPAKENADFEKAILEDLELLQVKPDRFTHSSDYFDLMINLCEKLINDNKAYVDDTPAELMKEQREQRLPSTNRDNSREKNFTLWQEMKKGTEIGQECCVRAKIDYENVNGCLRDPTIYRCKPEPHPRTGKNYNVYPTYDFACPIVDSVENVTHTLRTTEYHDRDEQFYWFIDALELRKPYIWAYSRLNMTNTVLSKRKLTWFVNNNIVDGWDDPRFPTVRGILRRGMTVDGLKQFIIAQGSSRSVVFMEWDKVWAINKKIIDPLATRYTALDSKSLVHVIIVDDIDSRPLTVQNHPKDVSKGTKKVFIGRKLLIERDDANLLRVGENATFINWGNLKIKDINKENGKIVEVTAKLNLEDRDFKGTVKLTWLLADDHTNKRKVEANKVKCVAVYFDHIISKPVLGKDDDFKDYVAKNTRKEVMLLGEPELKRVKHNEIIQLQRKGFFRCDVPFAELSDFSSRERFLILFHIPDGHTTASSAIVPVQEAKALLESKSFNMDLEFIKEKIGAQGTQIEALKSAQSDKKIIDKEAKSENTPEESREALNKKIVIQGNKIRILKSAKSEKKIIEEEVKTLLTLKATYKKLFNVDWNPITDKGPLQMPQETEESLNSKIIAQGDKIRALKSSKADKTLINDEVKLLLELKNVYKKLTNEEWKPHSIEVQKKTRKQGSVSQSVKMSESTKTGTRLGLEVKKSDNLAEWYSQVITKGEMIEYYDVSGCYILRPWSYSIWDVIKDFLNNEIKKLGVQNCYFPIFVSKAVLEREKNHIADFAPEVAWVTKSGESQLAEPIAIRPTSETVMYPAYAKWVKSYRDLPLKLNQWNNVVRWEFKHPQPFLRTREFLWQEGHSAFMTKNEADEEVLIILELYARIYEDFLAIPVVRGRKTEKEKFAGGDYTTTVEAFISASGRAIQGATSHHLGLNFSKMFDIQVEGAEENGEKSFVYQNSWGITTRTIGVMVMVHGDDKGLVLPPMVASIQVVVVPCGITGTTTKEQREKLIEECRKLETELNDGGVLRVKADFRDNYSPGWKFNHWELKGVPIRIELGFKDLAKKQVTLVRRDNSEKFDVKRDNVKTIVENLLKTIQKNMYKKANDELKSHIKACIDWKDFCRYLDDKNLILAPFCGEIICEDKIKADSVREHAADEPGAPSMGAKSLCIPFEQPTNVCLGTLKCIHPRCTKMPKFHALFGRSY